MTDPTNAAGWEVFDVTRGEWKEELLDLLGVNPGIAPRVVPSCTAAGPLRAGAIDGVGAPGGVPVAVATGDHQCSFVGSVADHAGTIAVNVGTGGQTSVHLDDLGPLRGPVGTVEHGWLELRPAVQEGYLLAGVGVVGGRTFRVMRDFVADAVAVSGAPIPDVDEFYDRLVAAATQVDSDAGGAVWDPTFTGGRHDPR